MQVHDQNGKKVFVASAFELVIAGAIIVLGLLLVGLYFNHQNKQVSKSSYDTGYKAGTAATASANQASLASCLDRVEQEYRLTLDNTKKDNGISSDTGLPTDLADHIEAQYKDRKDTCLRQYPTQ